MKFSQSELIRDLYNRIEDLVSQVEELRGRLEASDDPVRQRVLLAKRTATGAATWKEQTVFGGAVVDFIDGRDSTTADASNIINLPADTLALLEYQDTSNTAYVPISGGELPLLQYAGMAYRAWADNQQGGGAFDFLTDLAL
jgi:hypothetical protein